MENYSKFIAPERRSVPTPPDMVKDGKCVFGTFDKEFETMDLLGIKNPTAAPDCFKRLKLTLWEAMEVHLEEGLLLAVCCDMGVFGLTFHVFYDKRTKKVYSFSTNVKSKETFISPNLLNGAETKARGDNFHIRYVNDFQDGRCHAEGHHDGDDGHIEYNFELKRISKPGVVSIPFADPQKRHRPLYSQKDFFKIEGTLTLNGETFHTTENSSAIIDDHRGYYPRKAHYDWLTTMGIHDADGERKWFAFNLTRNQSIDQDKYNENLIWLENRTSLLTPITFTRDIPTMDFKDHAIWKIKDEHDMVNIEFHVDNVFKMITHAKPFVNIEYFVAFGTIYGYVRGEDGKLYVLDGMTAMGEDKDLLF